MLPGILIDFDDSHTRTRYKWQAASCKLQDTSAETVENQWQIEREMRIFFRHFAVFIASCSVACQPRYMCVYSDLNSLKCIYKAATIF